MEINNIQLNDQWFLEENKKSLDSDGNQNTTHQKLWDTAKAVLRGSL
jgi:hypothetical protein